MMFAPLWLTGTVRCVMRCLRLVSVVLLSQVPAVSTAEEPAQANLIHFCTKGYENNRKSFSFATVRVKITSGHVLSIDDATKGVFVVDRDKRHPVVWNARWVFSGTKMVCEEKCEIQYPRVKVPGESTVTVSCVDKALLTDGTFRLSAVLNARIGNISDSRETPNSDWGFTHSPFQMGMMGSGEFYRPYETVQRYENQNGLVAYEGLKVIDSHRVHTIAVGKSKTRVFARYHFDQDQGFLPVKVDYPVDEDNPGGTLGYVLESRKCSDDRFFPMKTVVVQSPGRPTGEKRGAALIEVTQLDVDTMPSDKDFTINLPKGMAIAATKDPSFAFSLGADRTVELKDLPSMLKTALAPIPVKLKP